MTIRTWALAFGLVFAASPIVAQLQEPVGPINEAPAASAPIPPPPAQPAASSIAQNTPAPSTAPANAKVIVPTGTHIPLVLHNAISTRSARPGDPVYFETVFPVMIDGRVVIPAGSYVSGEVTQSKRAGKVKGKAQIAIRLTTMILPNSYEVSLAAMPSNAGTGGGETTNNEGTITGDSDKASDAGTVIRTTEAGTGIGAGVGAASGHIGEGVGIGAAAGAAAGLAAILLTRGPDAELPRGTTLDAVLDRPVALDASKVQFAGPGNAPELSGPPNREPQRQKVPF
jgi:type IV secretion system protein VirB10